jgi:uncharacterized repeat protein (TIGR01451 family)
MHRRTLTSVVPLGLIALAALAPLALAQAANQAADLAITKADSPDPATVGGQVTFTINVTNLGPRTQATGVTVTDVLPAGYTYVSGSAGCSAAGGVVTCNVGNLAKDATATVQIVVQAVTAGHYNNTATVSGNNADPNAANNAATTSTRVRTAAPDDLVCVAMQGRVQLTWEDVAQATSYNVYRATSSGGFILLATTTVERYDDTTAANGQTYRYRVTAVSAGGESAPSNECTTMAIPLFPSLLAGAVATVGAVGAFRLMRRR